jgi:G3E family GTPase
MTPLVLVVGFLGSGKTTFLKGLIPALAARGIQPGLLINDYQNAKVDAEQFRELIDEVRALSGDCVCCGSREQLFDELRGFRHGANRVMILETNGTTDAGALIEALALDPALEKFTDPIQITVIDAQRWQKRFWHNALEREQAMTASHVVISRRDTVPEKRWTEVQQSLVANQIRGRQTDVETFAGELLQVVADASSVPSRTVCQGRCDHEHGGHSHDHEQSHFASCELPLPAQVSRLAFERFLKNLPREVIRAKGLVCFEDKADEFFVFQRIDDDVQFIPVGSNPRINTPLALLIGPAIDAAQIASRISDLTKCTEVGRA